MLKNTTLKQTLITVIAFSYPFVYNAIENYTNINYVLLPILGIKIIYPLVIGGLIAFFQKSISQIENMIFFLLNAILTIIVWYAIPGFISIYNLMIIGILGNSIIKDIKK